MMAGSISFPILLAANPTAWLTPIWLWSFGLLMGLVVLAGIYGLVKLVAPGLAQVMEGTLREGFVGPVLSLAAGFGAFAVLSLFLSAVGVGYLPMGDLWRSMVRLPFSNSFSKTYTVPVAPAEERGGKPYEVVLDYRPQEMRSVEVTTDQDIEFYLRDPGTFLPGSIPVKVALAAGKSWTWPSKPGPAGSAENNPFLGRRATLYVLNAADQPANLTISGVTREEYPQVATVPWTAAGLVVLMLFYLILRLSMPKIMAVASTTSKEAVSQPLFQVVLAVGAFLLVAFVFIPYNTFGEDVKELKITALELIMVAAVLVAAWTASVSISDEIEGRTALTVLSKPIGRIQFLLGKLLGVMQSVSLLYLVLGAVLLITVSGKVVYDVRESSLPEALWTDSFEEMRGIVPGLVLAFFETIVITSISVAISTRLPMLPNMLICFSVYALGNLAPMLVQSHVHDPYGIVHFVGQLLATILPVLENFNIQAAISAGWEVPLPYLFWALLYCLLYSTIAMFFALILFEDRDLA
jgi:ABC-type transport system involved in multi-copper enzyme maturation permease subunit